MLKRAIDSCIQQTVPCRVVVVDEASTDATPEVAQSYPAITYIRNSKAVGHSAAANIGIKEAPTAWIKPLDDDDWLAPTCIAAMTQAVAKAQSAGLRPVIVAGHAINVDQNGREIGRTRSISDVPFALHSRELLGGMLFDQVPVGTPVEVGHSREAAIKVGGWNEQRTVSDQFGDEVELWIKLAAEGDGVFIPDFVGYRTMWPGNSHVGTPHEQRYRSNLDLKGKIARHLGIDTPSDLQKFLALHWAMIAAKEKSFGQAFKLGLKSVTNPLAMAKLMKKRKSPDLKLIRL